MKSNIYDIMQRLGQRLLLCFIATTLSCAVYAQDESDDSFAEEGAEFVTVEAEDCADYGAVCDIVNDAAYCFDNSLDCTKEGDSKKDCYYDIFADYVADYVCTKSRFFLCLMLRFCYRCET